jgi:uncharacterized protein
MDLRTEKESALIGWLLERRRIAIGYSGGVDSAYLAAVAVATLGAGHVLAIIGRSPSYPDSQWRNAREVAARIGLTIEEIDTHEMDDPRYAANPNNRCYFCKTELWTRLAPIAHARGFETVADGTNADDLRGHRPGALAAREHAIASPLAEAGFTKADVRAFSKARGLPTWEQPSSPCLSSRIPYGTPVTIARLKRVERAEAGLRELGIVGDLRVRHFGDTARVELSPNELRIWSAEPNRNRLEAVVIGAGYSRAEVDPRGFRSGALNERSAAAAD